MQIIAQKNSKYTIPDFFGSVINFNYLSGIVLNVVKTLDNVLIVVNLSTTEISYLNTVYSNEFLKLKGFEFVKLDEIMKYLKRINYQKKIILNIIPLKPIQLTDKQNLLLIEEYKEYARNLREIVNQVNMENIYVHSISRSLLMIIKKENLNIKLGFAIAGFDLNYIDVDYYVFSVNMLNFPLLKEQVNLNKEIMVYIGNEYELSYLYDIFKGNKKTDLTTYIYEYIYLIGNYPEIVNETFKN